MNQADRRKLVAAAAADVARAFPGSISVMADKDLTSANRWASTGSVALDRVLSRSYPGGLPTGPKRGRVFHLFGDPSTGKTVILDHMMLSNQRQGGHCLYSQTEEKDPHFPWSIGLDLSSVVMHWPDTIELMIDMGLEWIARVRAKDRESPILWGIDSLEMVEADRTFGVRMSGKEGGKFDFGGGRAAAISQGFRKVARVCSQGPTSLVILNQVKDAIGVMFGAKKKPGGGHAPKFFASVEVSLSFSKYGKVDSGVGNIVAQRWVHARAVKNKVASPFAEADVLIDFEKGVHLWAGLMEQLVAEARIKRDGSQFMDCKTGEILEVKDFVTWAKRPGVL